MTEYCVYWKWRNRPPRRRVFQTLVGAERFEATIKPEFVVYDRNDQPDATLRLEWKHLLERDTTVWRDIEIHSGR